ncbi:TMhelix containing protein [Vibrio phage 1.015.O._10N.222.51.E5]|nr:TMhelix containing protein [Vibrio phage 1.015.O._10N.222.51.E5]AUR83392.1 TMhelix containing protein [Vibrio phage 1.034.O._10N.261.46.B7]AUR83459.1 TMhelix containing protein [Vibrio phage 1.034.X._10N.261.46.B7]
MSKRTNLRFPALLGLALIAIALLLAHFETEASDGTKPVARYSMEDMEQAYNTGIAHGVNWMAVALIHDCKGGATVQLRDPDGNMIDMYCNTLTEGI